MLGLDDDPVIFQGSLFSWGVCHSIAREIVHGPQIPTCDTWSDPKTSRQHDFLLKNWNDGIRRTCFFQIGWHKKNQQQLQWRNVWGAAANSQRGRVSLPWGEVYRRIVCIRFESPICIPWGSKDYCLNGPSQKDHCCSRDVPSTLPGTIILMVFDLRGISV